MKAEKRLATVLLSLTLLFVSGFFPAYGKSSCCLPDRSAAAEKELAGFRKAEAQQTEFQQADVQQETAGDSTEAVAAEEQNRSGMPAEWPGYEMKGEYNENTERDNGQHADPV